MQVDQENRNKHSQAEQERSQKYDIVHLLIVILNTLFSFIYQLFAMFHEMLQNVCFL